MALTNQELARMLTRLSIDCMAEVNMILGEDSQVMVNGFVTTRYLRGLLDELHVYCDELRRRLPDTGRDSLKYSTLLAPVVYPDDGESLDDRHHYESLLYGDRRRRKAKLGVK